jgi:hypothetical protein
MVSTGSDSLTVLFGNGGRIFRSYTISTMAWANLGNAPNNVNVGGGLTYQPSTAYFALAGGSSTRFWKFTLSSNSWSTMATIPNAVGAGGGLTYIYSTTSQYSVTGNFISSVKDTGKSGRLLNSIFWDETLPSSANQRITVEVRASDTLVGGVPNAAWTLLPSQAPVTGSSTDYSSLSSLSGQYVQYKIEMCTSDVAATPSLSEVRLYYASY